MKRLIKGKLRNVTSAFTFSSNGLSDPQQPKFEGTAFIEQISLGVFTEFFQSDSQVWLVSQVLDNRKRIMFYTFYELILSVLTCFFLLNLLSSITHY